MAMQLGSGNDGDPISEINSTPLIDVMLVLLVMLIITIPAQTHAVKLDMPVNAPVTPAAAPPDPVAVDIDFDGTVSWNGVVVDQGTLDQNLTAIASLPFDRQPELHVRPHKRSDYGDVVRVMASAQRHGVTKLGIIGGAN
jgi:biopolymer transport protein ExbD